MVFANKAMATRSHMERQVQDWIEQAAVVPPGNGVEAHLWGEGSGGEGDSSSSSEAELMSKMSPTERAAYETKKLKLRKAMVRGAVCVGHVVSLSLSLCCFELKLGVHERAWRHVVAVGCFCAMR